MRNVFALTLSLHFSCWIYYKQMTYEEGSPWNSLSHVSWHWFLFFFFFFHSINCSIDFFFSPPSPRVGCRRVAIVQPAGFGRRWAGACVLPMRVTLKLTRAGIFPDRSCFVLHSFLQFVPELHQPGSFSRQPVHVLGLVNGSRQPGVLQHSGVSKTAAILALPYLPIVSNMFPPLPAGDITNPCLITVVLRNPFRQNGRQLRCSTVSAVC